jgi:response regulator of citrate/malate metabolism
MRYNRIGKDLFLDDTVSAYKQAKTNLSNNNPLSHSDLQALSNAIDNPVNNAKEAEKMLSNLSDDVIAENLSKATDKMIEKNLMHQRGESHLCKNYASRCKSNLCL